MFVDIFQDAAHGFLALCVLISGLRTPHFCRYIYAVYTRTHDTAKITYLSHQKQKISGQPRLHGSKSGSHDFLRKFRAQVRVELILLVLDCAVILSFLLNCPWRWKRTFCLLSKFPVTVCPRLSEDINIRARVFSESINTFIDLALFSVSSVGLLVPWRVLELVRAVVMQDTITKKRMAAATVGINAFLDLVCLPFFLVVLVTLYRFPFLCVEYYDAGVVEHSAKRRRVQTIRHFLSIFVDILAFFSLVATVATVYRIPWLVHKIRTRCNTLIDVDLAILLNLGLIIMDIPFIIMGAIVTCLLWRAFFLWRDILQSNNADERRSYATKHFVSLICDIFDTPLVIMNCLIILTFWRAPCFIIELSHVNKRKHWRKATLTQFKLWLLDIPTFILLALLVVTIYRVFNLYRELKLHFTFWWQSSVLQTKEHTQASEDNPMPQNLVSWHLLVLKEFFELIKDIPFPVLALCTLWRIPFLLRKSFLCETAVERRRLIFYYFTLTLKDIPCIFLLLTMLCTLWRVPSIISSFYHLESEGDEHTIIFSQFISWIYDLPFVLLAPLVLLAPWHYKDFFCTVWHFKSAPYYRGTLFLFSVTVVCDYICTALCIICLCSGLRTCSLIPFFRVFHDRLLAGTRKPILRGGTFITALRKAATHCTVQLLIDICTLIGMGVIAASVFHFWKLVRCCIGATFRFYGRRPSVFEDSEIEDCLQMGLLEKDRSLELGNFPLTLTLYRRIVCILIKPSLVDFPHLVFLPIKVTFLMCYTEFHR